MHGTNIQQIKPMKINALKTQNNKYKHSKEWTHTKEIIQKQQYDIQTENKRYKTYIISFQRMAWTT